MTPDGLLAYTLSALLAVGVCVALVAVLSIVVSRTRLGAVLRRWL